MNFSLLIGGKRFDRNGLSAQTVKSLPPAVQNCSSVTETVYKIGTLEICERSEIFPNAERRLLTFKNLGAQDTELLSEICDVDEDFDLPAKSLPLGFRGDLNREYLHLEKTLGSNYDNREFSAERTALRDGETQSFGSYGGRCSQGYAPFFELLNSEGGILVGIGWTGDWRTCITKRGDSVNLIAGIPNLSFRLRPGEIVRTASALVLRYVGNSVTAHNAFKQIVKASAPENIRKGLPFFFSYWGADHTSFLLRHLEETKRSGMAVDAFWLDAGWFGTNDGTPSGFYNAWGANVGNWRVNESLHPKKMTDAFDFSKKCGFLNLLWLEPERAELDSEAYLSHPELYLRAEKSKYSALLDLGKPEAREFFFDMVSGLVETYKLDFYRQDFNMDPLQFWDENDEPDRRGIRQIKHVMGLYEVWDRLLAKFPRLIIDNCASGGRRLDIETLSRSVPLWRSDYQCEFDANPEAAQNHNVGISQWIPFTSTGTGIEIADKYRMRSAYASALNTNFFGYESIAPETIPEELRETAAEWQSVKRFFSCDLYPIFGRPLDGTTWGGWQFDDPETGEGIVSAFRRADCRLDSATVFLGGLNRGETLRFEDKDSKESFTVSAEELMESGLGLSLPSPRSSKLLVYRKI